MTWLTWFPHLNLHDVATFFALWFAASLLVLAGWVARVNVEKAQRREAREALRRVRAVQ